VKRIIIGISFVLLFSATAMASMFIDSYATFLGAGDAKYQYGGGAALGFTLNDRFNILYRGMYTLYNKNATNFNPIKKEYNHMMHILGAEYVYHIDRFHLDWRSSLMAGFSKTTMDQVPRGGGLSTNLDDMGVAIALWTGIQFNATQNIAPFFDFGFHKSFFTSSLSHKNIWGINMMAGIRFYLGSHRNIDDRY
jgi:hypothetical protein